MHAPPPKLGWSRKEARVCMEIARGRLDTGDLSREREKVRERRRHALQGYLAHKKMFPHRTTVGPSA